MKRDRTITRSVQPDQVAEMTILEVRLSCKSDTTLAAVLDMLEGALGVAESISRSYENRTDDAKRVYIKFIVPTEAR